MKTLLRHTRTGLYFQGPDRWTDDPERAYDFHFNERALQYVATWDLKEVELAFGFEEAHAIASASSSRPGPQLASAGR